MTEFDRAVYDAVKKIPKGKVATYSQIAEAIGHPGAARAVGNSLHKNPDHEHVFCYRVVSSKGYLSKDYAFGGIMEQKRRLSSDGIWVIKNTVDLEEYCVNADTLK